jgi:hypothetical protein
MTWLLLIFLLFTGTAVGAAQPTSGGETADEACERRAEASSSLALRHGDSQAKADLRYQTSMLRCNGVTDASRAAYFAAMRVELARLGNLFLAHKIAMKAYVSEVQDRRSKLALAEHSHSFAAAYVASGDEDGDFVPNSLDRCRKSPPDSLTDERGCPAKPSAQLSWIVHAQAEEPSPETIDRIAATMGYLASPGCTDAPMPQPSEPVHQGFIRSAPEARYSITVTKVLNQPAKCAVFYQVELQFINPPGSVWPTQQLQVTFRDDENVDTTAQAPNRRVFQIKAAAAGVRKEVYVRSFRYGEVVWRVRALNGNGMRSMWSPPRREPFDGVYDPLR